MTLIIILTFNVLFLISIRIDKKYWLVPIPLWCLLVSAFFTWRNINDAKILQLDGTYWKSAEDNKMKDSTNWRGDEIILKNLDLKKAYVKKHNSTFLNSIFLQTIFTFIAQLIGYKKTSLKKTYKWTSIVFGILFVLNLWLTLLMAIVPTGPIV